MRFTFLLALIFADLIRAEEFRPPLMTTEGYAVPQPGWKFEFPRDHGSHPAFKIEWWYVTGHLEVTGGKRFGFQATFFRQAQRPPGTSVENKGPAHIHLSHMALMDVEGGRFIHQERLARDSWDAFASTTTLDVRNGPWSLRLGEKEVLELVGGIRAEASWKLTMTPSKPLVIFG